ncbi:MAG: hypothetical protein ACREBR_03660, partial [bacterium]
GELDVGHGSAPYCHGMHPNGGIVEAGGDELVAEAQEADLDEESNFIYQVEGGTCGAAAERLFQVGSIWKSKKHLFTVVKRFSIEWGFATSVGGYSAGCNRGGETRKRKHDKKITRNTISYLKVNCTFCIRCSPNKRWLNDSGRVKITPSSCYTHSGGCTPGHGQLVVARRAAGDFATIHPHMAANLALMVRRDPAISTKTLRALLAPCFPEGAALKTQMLLNIRNRAKTKSLTMDQNADVIGAKEKYGSHIKKGLEDRVITDMVSKFAHDILQETRREQGRKDQNCWIFVQYLENLRRNEKGFTFRINADNKGIPSCVVWMTPAMRAAFERFGWFVCLDAMKRQLNQFHWPA